uniref:Uncharacterized protein n=1 Tax=Knipowitschia caucasica TaxID=637954 RepID=A0AAV2KC77_KNICA
MVPLPMVPRPMVPRTFDSRCAKSERLSPERLERHQEPHISHSDTNHKQTMCLYRLLMSQRQLKLGCFTVLQLPLRVNLELQPPKEPERAGSDFYMCNPLWK